MAPLSFTNAGTVLPTFGMAVVGIVVWLGGMRMVHAAPTWRTKQAIFGLVFALLSGLIAAASAFALVVADYAYGERLGQITFHGLWTVLAAFALRSTLRSGSRGGPLTLSAWGALALGLIQLGNAILGWPSQLEVLTNLAASAALVGMAVGVILWWRSRRLIT